MSLCQRGADVSLSVSGLPAGVTASFIQGYSSGGFTHSQNITLTVTP